MKLSKRQLRRIIREEAKSTKKYDDDSALKGDQSELPDALQKGIIDKSVEDREESEKDKNESLRRYLKRIINENTAEVFGLFNEDYIYDILSEEVERYLQSAGGDAKLRKDELGKVESAMMSALKRIAGEYAQ